MERKNRVGKSARKLFQVLGLDFQTSRYLIKDEMKTDKLKEK